MEKETYLFDIWEVFNGECGEKLEEWKKLMNGSFGVCLFAAPWPPAEPDYWRVSGIKTDLTRLLVPRYDPEYIEEEVQPSLDNN
jgi:hypothetical protein